ncbi:MAG: long-chain-acyl-CoA synthetase [Candidatus Heimdallarchaeota archaeon]|nr:long-chain-acyl-CoA synthetase [Candidatus Heimdallarchaeota archaeon]
MNENNKSKKGYIIPEEDYKKQMEYINIMDPYPPDLFYKLFLEYNKKARTEVGINFGSIIEDAAVKYPNRIAVKWDDKDIPVTAMQMIVPHIKYKEFNENINRYANYFLKIGLKKGDIICLLVGNRVDSLILHAAAAKVGAISSMMNTGWRSNTLSYAINLNPCKAIIIGEELINLFNQTKAEINKTEDQKLYFLPDSGKIQTPPNIIDMKEEIKNMSIDNPPTTRTISIFDPCHLVFTSGTTGGKPKAAFTMHKTMIENAYAFEMILDLQKNDTIYAPLPFFHNTFLTATWPPAMKAGSAIAIRRKFSASRFWDDTRKFRATKFCYVGELCRYLMNQAEKPDDGLNPVNGIYGNGLRPEVWKAFKKRFNIISVNEFYGSAELPSGFVNQYNFDCTIGRSVKKNAVVAYDIDRNEPIRDKDGFIQKVDFGKVGLCIFEVTEKEPLLGYTNKDDTEKKLLHDVFQKGDTWFNTGDLMRNIGYGHRQFVDRLGDTFRWHGENVSTTEVEAVLDSSKQIYISATYGVKIPNTEGRAGMAAVVILDKTLEEFDFKKLSELLKNKLPDFAIPKFLRFKANLKQTPTMKIKKNKLKKEEYDITIIKDPVYVLLPGEETYQPLTAEILKNMKKGTYKF